VAISPIEKRFARAMTEKLGLTFPLLGDPGNRTAAAFNLVITVPEPLQEVYRGWGIDLERVNGDASWTLPLPSRYVIDRNGIVVDARNNTDHTRRPEPEQTLAVLRGMKS